MSDYKAKMHKIRSASFPDVGAYSAPPDPYLYLRRPISKGRAGKDGRGEEGGGKLKREGKKKGEMRRGEGREREGLAPKYFGLEPPVSTYSTLFAGVQQRCGLWLPALQLLVILYRQN